MKKQPLISKITSWIVRFVQVQLFLTAVSAPILLSWGLPISVLSLLGNLLFFPALVAFLTLSSTIFFLELLHIPNGAPIWCLEKLTSAWLSAMSLTSGPKWLVSFRTPSEYLLILLPLLAFGILYYKKTSPLSRSVPLLALLLVCSFGYLKITGQPTTVVEQIPCNGGQITLIKSDGTTTLIDPGVLGRRGSASSWAEYTLANHFYLTFPPILVDKAC